MRHKWKKQELTEEFYWEIETPETNRTVYGISFKNHTAYQVKKCIQCGLKKGLCKSMGFFPSIVYYRYLMNENRNKLLSIDRIPYTCKPIFKEINEDFLSEEEVLL